MQVEEPGLPEMKVPTEFDSLFTWEGGGMKRLVTGRAGFIGSAVVRQAVAAGHSVVNLDALTYAACLDNVAMVADSPNYTFEQADIRDRAARDRIFVDHKPDAVMHLAAESHVDRSIDGPGDFIETNIACAVADIASSDYPTPAQRPLNSRMDCALLETIFGIPQPDWRLGLSDILKDLGARA